jgi:hypothetical protein
LLGRANGYDPEFQKEHLKLSGEEPTPVITNEIEKLVSELPRDGHVFQKNRRRMYDCKTCLCDFGARDKQVYCAIV